MRFTLCLIFLLFITTTVFAAPQAVPFNQATDQVISETLSFNRIYEHNGVMYNENYSYTITPIPKHLPMFRQVPGHEAISHSESISHSEAYGSNESIIGHGEGHSYGHGESDGYSEGNSETPSVLCPPDEQQEVCYQADAE